jgi:hypothetical protein
VIDELEELFAAFDLADAPSPTLDAALAIAAAIEEALQLGDTDVE